MRVLVLAPHPFYQERGTPIAVDLLVRGLVDAGCEVDLVVFDEGEPRSYPGLNIIRTGTLPRVSGIRPGFSAKKIYSDLFLAYRAFRLLLSKRYDMVHAVEESAFLAMVFCPLFRVRYIYDMDSSMATQILDKYPALRPVAGVLHWLESLPMRFAAAVVPVCDALAVTVRQVRSDGVFILKDVSMATADGVAADDLRLEHGIQGPLLMYIGNLETYQGIDLMLEAFALLMNGSTTYGPIKATLVILGGEAEHIAHYRNRAAQLGLAGKALLLGKKPVAAIDGYMRQATVLLSPRTQGVNTPMKIYSYLDSAAAVLATDLPTHTQVLTDKIAMLTAPTAAAMAQGMAQLLDDEALRQRLTHQANQYVRREHSREAFLAQLYAIYSSLAPQHTWPQQEHFLTATAEQLPAH